MNVMMVDRISKMNNLIIGQQYMITRKHDGNTKPPAPVDTLVEIMGYDKKRYGFVVVKYIRGFYEQINTTEKIKYDDYEFEYSGDTYTKLQDEFARFKVIQGEVQANLKDYIKMKDEIHKDIKRYKEMEWEVLFLRAAIIIIVWMYIKGVIKFV